MKLLLLIAVLCLSFINCEPPRAIITTGLDCSTNALVCNFEQECCGDAVINFGIMSNHWHQSIKVCYFKDQNSI